MYVCAVEYKVALEGKVIQRAECRPIENAGYMALKRCVQLVINVTPREHRLKL